MSAPIKIAIVDDHTLLRAGLARLIESFSDCTVICEAGSGYDLINKIGRAGIPDIVLVDINMPDMNGYETTRWLKQNYPQVRVLALSMHDNETAMVSMLKVGIKGWILKNSEPAQLKCAINSIAASGFHYTETMTGKLISIVNKEESTRQLNDREIEFLRLVCSELTYKQIADRMCKGTRTIDGYRDALFDKLRVKTRVGLVMYAIKNGIVNLYN